MGRAGQGRAWKWGHSGGNLSPGLSGFACLVPFVSVCVQEFASMERDFVGQRAPRHRKTTTGCFCVASCFVCLCLTVSGACVFLFDFLKYACVCVCVCVPHASPHVCFPFSRHCITSCDASPCSTTVWPVLISLHLDCLNCLSSVKFLFT